MRRSVAYFTELTNAKSNEESQNKGESSDEMGWIIDVKRRDTPRDLLSLRTITKKRSDASLVKSEHRLPLTVAPNQPSLEVSLEQVEGRSQASDRLEDLVKSISKATAQDPVLTLKTRSPSVSESDASVSGSKTTPRLPPSIARRTSDSTRAVPAPPSAFRPTRSVSSTTIPSTPILPAQSPLSGSIPGVSTPGPTTSTHNTMKTSNGNGNGDGSKDSWSSVTSTFTNSLNTFMRLGSDMGSFRMRGGDRSLSSLMGPLSMISAMDNSLSNSNLDDRPHIQFTYTLPEKLRIECTVFYATAFDSLRRRCAIDRSILDSLARCEPWDAQGGKSKASFFMSGDKRYIVKELVSKWNVSDT
jgi:1-phosphatidylinositol-3-phosphate 5-kinase